MLWLYIGKVLRESIHFELHTWIAITEASPNLLSPAAKFLAMPLREEPVGADVEGSTSP
jgi:hypothetical protein